MEGAPLLAIRNLAVRFTTPDGPVEAVRGIDVDVARGEAVAIVGESGSGKSQAMLATLGLLAANGGAEGSATFDGAELIGASEAVLNRYRGARISMIFQEPMTSLDPLYRIGRQIAEPLRHHQGLNATARRKRVIELMTLVGIADPARRARSYPHQLSGGERQRAMIAMALANRPELLIADEPTTALDVTIQAQILELIASLRKKFGLAVVFITHDLNIVRRLCDRVYVMRAGEVVEAGPTQDVMSAPRHAYTRLLVAAEPGPPKAEQGRSGQILLDARGVRVSFQLRPTWFGGGPTFVAVDDVSLTLRQGQTLGVVGESGSGKSTLARALLRLLPCQGRIVFEGREIGSLDKAGLRPMRRDMQMVFQDPFGSLSPRLTASQIVSEGLLVHEPSLGRADRAELARAVLVEVGIDAGSIHRYPHEFSGGQRQRIAIARAMVLRPKLVVLDEPTSALDRTVQKQIVDLLLRLQAEHGLAYLFISHDLAVIRAMSDTIAVMKAGKVVETGTTRQIFAAPQHPYTQTLLRPIHPPGPALGGERRVGG
ncbi:MAG: ABC transporter ATP-binding protein [Bauldia sp.]